MPEPTSPIGELKQLNERERRRVLATLDPDERSQVISMLAAGEPPQPSFEAMAGFSPWLLKKIDLARDEGGDCALTPASRELLLHVFKEMVTRAQPAPDGKLQNLAARSFLRRIFHRRAAP